MSTKLNVSVATFNEIANALEQKGIKLTKEDTIVLGRDIALVPPIDYRLVTIRRDCITEAVKIHYQGENIIDLANKIYEFVLNNKIESKKEWE